MRVSQKLRVYQHKDEVHKFKVVFFLNNKLPFLMQALTNLELWSKWHPNVESVEIIGNNPDKNIIEIVLKGKGPEFEAYL
jgi:hypothetical protein